MAMIDTYRNHPFRVLGASPRDTRAALAERQADLALFGDDGASEEALAALLHPATRLEAELRWFPQADTEEVERLLRCVEEALARGDKPWSDASRDGSGTPRDAAGTSSDASAVPRDASGTSRDGSAAPNMPSMLGQFNAVRLLLSTLPCHSPAQLESLLPSLSVVSDALLPRQVMDELNLDRRVAGFPELDEAAELEAGLKALFHETLRELLSHVEWKGDRDKRGLAESLREAYTNRTSPYHNSFLLQLADHELA